MRIRDWSSDVCSSVLHLRDGRPGRRLRLRLGGDRVAHPQRHEELLLALRPAPPHHQRADQARLRGPEGLRDLGRTPHCSSPSRLALLALQPSLLSPASTMAFSVAPSLIPPLAFSPSLPPSLFPFSPSPSSFSPPPSFSPFPFFS